MEDTINITTESSLTNPTENESSVLNVAPVTKPSKEESPIDISHIASVLDDIAMRHDKEVTIGLLDQLHPQKYSGDTHLAMECRAWLQKTANPSLGRVLVMGFLLNRGLVFMTQPHATSDGAQDSWGALIESKQMHDIISDTDKTDAFNAAVEQPGDTWALALGDETEKDDVDLSAFEKELHALSAV